MIDFVEAMHKQQSSWDFFGTGARFFLDDLLGGGMLILFLIELVEFLCAVQFIISFL